MNYAILPAINQLPASIAVLDFDGRIVGVNNAWKLFGRENGLDDPNSCVGADYVAACSASSPELVGELSDLIVGRRRMMARWYPCHHPVAAQRWFLLLGTRDDEARRITLSHIDVSMVLNPSLVSQIDAEAPDLPLC
jgi:hypothetical protein